MFQFSSTKQEEKMDIGSLMGDDEDEMIENSIGRDLHDGEMIESSLIGEPRVGEDGEIIENHGGMGSLPYGGDTNLEPYEGMEFESEEAAKAFYDAYARRIGFITRVSTYCRSKIDGAVISRRLVCNKEGFKKGKVKRPLAVTREGCKAMVNLKREKPGKWIISKIGKDHNHPLLITSKVRRGSLQNRSVEYWPLLRWLWKHLDDAVQPLMLFSRLCRAISHLSSLKSFSRYKKLFSLLHSWAFQLRKLREDAKKIRELSYQLHRANKQCAVYREHLDMVLKDIEEHTYHLSEKVQDIVHCIKKFESQEQQQSQHRHLP